MIAISLKRMLKVGPDGPFNGFPTVSPMMTAFCKSECLPLLSPLAPDSTLWRGRAMYLENNQTN